MRSAVEVIEGNCIRPNNNISIATNTYDCVFWELYVTDMLKKDISKSVMWIVEVCVVTIMKINCIVSISCCNSLMRHWYSDTSSYIHHYICEVIHHMIHQTSHAAQYNTMQYNTIRYNTIHYNTMQCNTIQYNNGIQDNTIHYNTIQYNTLRYVRWIE